MSARWATRSDHGAAPTGEALAEEGGNLGEALAAAREGLQLAKDLKDRVGPERRSRCAQTGAGSGRPHVLCTLARLHGVAGQSPD